MNMWDDRFREPGYAYGTEPNDFLRTHARELAGPCLSLAEGEGRNAVYLASLGLDVTAVDCSSVGLAKAHELARGRDVVITAHVCDLDSFSAEPESFRSIISIFAHVPPDVRRRLHANVVQWLLPGGIFLLEAYSSGQASRNTGGPRDPTLCMNVDQLREELSGMQFLIARETERDVMEGRFHTGMALVTQILARKPFA